MLNTLKIGKKNLGVNTLGNRNILALIQHCILFLLERGYTANEMNEKRKDVRFTETLYKDNRIELIANDYKWLKVTTSHIASDYKWIQVTSSDNR